MRDLWWLNQLCCPNCKGSFEFGDESILCVDCGYEAAKGTPLVLSPT
jgi:predicted amidophosphoribosyltransferase